MEELRTRIYICCKEGGEISVLSNRESFDLLGIEPHLEDNSKFLENTFMNNENEMSN